MVKMDRTDNDNVYPLHTHVEWYNVLSRNVNCLNNENVFTIVNELRVHELTQITHGLNQLI